MMKDLLYYIIQNITFNTIGFLSPIIKDGKAEITYNESGIKASAFLGNVERKTHKKYFCILPIAIIKYGN